MLARFITDLLSLSGPAARGRKAEKLFSSGLARERAGDYEAARLLYEESIAVQPLAMRWAALGDLCLRGGEYGKAEVCYRAALDQSPAAHLRLGRALQAQGRSDEAIGTFRRVYDMAPQDPVALRELVSALIQADNVRKAGEVVEAAVTARPHAYEPRLLLGLVQHKLHDPRAALQSYDAAAKLGGEDAELYDLRGAALQELGDLDAALANYERAVQLRPDFPPAGFHRSMIQLLRGDFANGWNGYELRKANPGTRRSRGFPAWDGAPLAGRTLLVRREQGLGDEIMFASLLPELVREAGACIVECDRRLVSLFKRSFPGATLFPSVGEASLPARLQESGIDMEVHAGSVPRFLRRSADAFPRHAGYLRAEPSRVAHWSARLAALGPGSKVGISWAGGVRKTRRALRSIPLTAWREILQTPGVSFVSLQYTPEAAQEAQQASQEGGVAIHHWAEAIEDYEETAALICALDLVISVCTSVVHLTGALGKPAWVLVPHTPEWRYGASGSAMVWYPSVRLIRQKTAGDWGPVISQVAADLRSASPWGGAPRPRTRAA